MSSKKQCYNHRPTSREKPQELEKSFTQALQKSTKNIQEALKKEKETPHTILQQALQKFHKQHNKA